MTFYTKLHELYCGIDLHAKRMYACVLDHRGQTLFHRNLKTRPQDLTLLCGRVAGRDWQVLCPSGALGVTW